MSRRLSLLHLCKTPRHVANIYLSPEQVLEIARAAQAEGCQEALFTLGDKPELRYKAAREALSDLGCKSTLEYVEKMAKLVLRETDLLPHLNPGVLGLEDYRRLRAVSPSMGLMRLKIGAGPTESWTPAVHRPPASSSTRRVMV